MRKHRLGRQRRLENCLGLWGPGHRIPPQFPPGSPISPPVPPRFPHFPPSSPPIPPFPPIAPPCSPPFPPHSPPSSPPITPHYPPTSPQLCPPDLCTFKVLRLKRGIHKSRKQNLTSPLPPPPLFWTPLPPPRGSGSGSALGTPCAPPASRGSGEWTRGRPPPHAPKGPGGVPPGSGRRHAHEWPQPLVSYGRDGPRHTDGRHPTAGPRMVRWVPGSGTYCRILDPPHRRYRGCLPGRTCGQWRRAVALRRVSATRSSGTGTVRGLPQREGKGVQGEGGRPGGGG